MLKLKSFFKIISCVTALLSLTVVYQNCSFQSYVNSSSQSSSRANELSITSVPYALLTSEQVLKSMASVTETVPNTAITSEYNRGQSVLASGYDLKMITSPMLMAVTNLASTFCDESLKREIAADLNQRKLFLNIDFTKSADAVTDANYQASLQRLGSAFWGRDLSDEELQILTEGKTDFMAPMSSTEQNQVASTKNLMLFTCTAMLSSFDSISF